MTAKKKLIRNIIISVMATAILLACYFFVLNWDVDKTESPSKMEGITFVVSEKIADVDSIHIENSDSEYDIVLTPDSQGEISYHISSLNHGRVNSDRLATAVYSLLKLTATDVLKQSGQNLSEFGLENGGSCHYTITKKDGSVLTVTTGYKTPDEKGLYCAVSGGSEIYVISMYDASAITAKPDDYCITSILNLHNATDVQQFILNKDDVKMMHVETTDSFNGSFGWKLTYPWQENIDTEKFASMLNELINIEATGFHNKEIEPAFEYEINLSDGDLDYHLSIGKDLSNGEVYLSDGENLYLVDLSVWNLVASIKPDDYLLKFVHLVYMDDVSAITMNYANQEYKMIPSNNATAYVFCDKEIAESDFKKLYQSIVGTLYTEHTTSVPDDKLYMKILYEFKDGKSEFVEYYENDERTFVAIRPNGTKVTVLKSELKTITDMLVEYRKK